MGDRTSKILALFGICFVVVVAVVVFVASTTSPSFLSVVTLGDSVAYDADPGIRAGLEATGNVEVDSRSFGGVGLLRPGADNYFDEAMLTKPDVVVVMLGGWDLGEIVAEPVTYERRLDDVAEMLTVNGARVVWLAMPPTPPSERLETARKLANRLFAELGDRNPSVDYLSTDEILGGPNGTFTRFRLGVDGANVQIRKVRDGRDDGHLCPGGAALLGKAVVEAIASFSDVGRPEGRWWEGKWVTDRRYDDPEGGCSVTE